MAKVDWNAGEYDTGGNFEVMPKGRYLGIVVDSEEKQTRNKDGSYFEFEFDVLAPKEFKRRKLWARLNIKNPSEVAQRIGREQFNGLCEAAGKKKEQVKETTALHNAVVVLIVDIRKNEQNGKDVNEVTGFLKPTAEASKAGEGYKPEAKRERSTSASGGQQPRREQPKREPSTVDDDDIPF